MGQWGGVLTCRFVLGRGNADPAPDELVLDASDDYNGLLQKTEMGVAWALREGFDFVFHACVDTYFRPLALLTSDFYEHDYVGHQLSDGHASGGAGYLMGRPLAEFIAGNGLDDTWEDLAVARAAARAGVPLHHDPRYHPERPPRLPLGLISAHLSASTGHYDVAEMQRCHAEFTGRP
jgi:hypothetical protein